MASLIVTPETGSATLQDTVGAWGYNFRGGTAYSNVRFDGYPFRGFGRADFEFSDGEYMRFCEGNTTDAANNNPLDDRIRMACDMGAGASGGPYATGVTSGNTQIVGANSHRYANASGVYTDVYSYSSNHYGNATAVINGVNS